MKKWTRPQGIVEQFEANEYVAGCYSLYCMVSGNGSTFTGNSYFEDNDKYKSWAEKSELGFTPDRQLHGAPCANGSSLNTETGKYYEYHRESAVGNITIGNDAGNGKNYAVWTSVDVNGTGTYKHYGYAVLDDKNRPNHS